MRFVPFHGFDRNRALSARLRAEPGPQCLVTDDGAVRPWLPSDAAQEGAPRGAARRAAEALRRAHEDRHAGNPFSSSQARYAARAVTKEDHANVPVIPPVIFGVGLGVGLLFKWFAPCPSSRCASRARRRSRAPGSRSSASCSEDRRS